MKGRGIPLRQMQPALILQYLPDIILFACQSITQQETVPLPVPLRQLVHIRFVQRARLIAMFQHVQLNIFVVGMAKHPVFVKPAKTA